MSIRAWSNDYISGFAEIDTQHRTLFQKVNTFAVKNDPSITTSALLSFIDELGDYCGNHFGLEESMMVKTNYPLLDFHTTQHTDLSNTVVDVRKKVANNELEEPYKTLIRFVSDWLNNHISRDDLTFISFCRNKDTVLDGFSPGEDCHVLTLDDEFIVSGKIDSIYKSEAAISFYADTQVPIKINDRLKIKTQPLDPNVRAASFIAIAHNSSPGSIRLINAVAIPVVNNRVYPRIKTDMNGKILKDGSSFVIGIKDVSAGGLLIETDLTLSMGDNIMIEFIVQNNLFVELCKIVRNADKSDLNMYGVQFVFQKSFQSEKLASFIFNRQSLGEVS